MFPPSSHFLPCHLGFCCLLGRNAEVSLARILNGIIEQFDRLVENDAIQKCGKNKSYSHLPADCLLTFGRFCKYITKPIVSL